MLNLGEYNTLKVAEAVDFGLYLKDDEGNQVLLPTKFCPEDYSLDQEIDVFILKDSEDRLLATTAQPKLLVNEFALLKVTALTGIGAFMDWGMDKELLVPFSEQKVDMEEGRWYVIYMGIDNETNRLYGSSKLNRYLQNQILSVEEGDKVKIVVYKKTELGYTVIVEDEHWGLVYGNEVFRELNVGDKLEAYVKNIRNDNKIDITLQPVGYDNVIGANSAAILNELEESGGFIPITDKGAPDDIYSIFEMSKKAFKKAVGDLYKQRKIAIKPEGISLIDD